MLTRALITVLFLLKQSTESRAVNILVLKLADNYEQKNFHHIANLNLGLSYMTLKMLSCLITV